MAMSYYSSNSLAPKPAPAPAPAPSSSSTLSIAGPVSFQGGSTDYTTAYNQALATNQQMYNNILSGYNSTMAYQQAQSNAIAGGYDQLQADVLGQLAGVQTAANQEAADYYAQQVGSQTQTMVDRGLGNTTVTNAVARGLGYDYQKILGQNAANFGQLNANYMNSIGQGQLNYQGQALNDTVGLANQQLQFMNSVSVPYPDPYAYAAMNQQAGAVSAGSAGGYPSGTGSYYGSPGGGGSAAPKNPLNSSFGNSGQYYTSGTNQAANTTSSYNYAAGYSNPQTYYPADDALGYVPGVGSMVATSQATPDYYEQAPMPTAYDPSMDDDWAWMYET